MREGDRLVEVNGANVAMENHKQVCSDHFNFII